ncbi:aromatic acid decarboxylase [Oleiphilus sp. HI0009]|uniref:flavin prenyltransferase UbiX n=2 Tax=Oleiphilus TaxID=141450 RepID=UPI0007C267E9|nr:MULTISPECIES: flavin prenyltransferase UbiX [unclassified Oleiphilus]KZX82297.1 aromatic acid decarboxylase [Oleiphilus sp. HI0009]KZY61907.1 aromatic acid decarboxylase [Oleiphilus sp. HI0066]KZY66682.1 aromatic acid decarboxylase [Oleiphilus sp. HI0066]KZY73121.1 aromatic acid decarboxylase [Oleiphilus sp. HI0067]
MSEFKETITLAVTGASGVQYATRLLDVLVKEGHQIFVMVSKAAHMVIATETEHKWPAQAAQLEQVLTQQFSAKQGQVKVFGKEDWMAPVASGSGAPTKMVVCPCSTGSLSAIANGASNNLIERAADVALKERRQLILVPREAPYSEIHLEHMLKLTKMGAVVIPASPGFYHKPQSVDDLVDFIVARILSQLGIEQTLLSKWGEDRT